MNENNLNTPNTSTTNVPSAEAVQQATTEGGGVFFIDFDIGSIASTLNYFTLAWCIVYSFILVSDFFFWRVMYSNLEVPRLRQGEKSIFDASRIWWTYLIPLTMYFIYAVLYETPLGSVMGLFVITAYVVKLIFDLPLIPVLGNLPNQIISAAQTSAKAVTPDLPKKKEEEKK